MKSNPTWYYDEKNHAGVNYSDQENVDEYDSTHAQFRDFESEALEIIQKLQIQPSDTILDIGCGSGELTLHFAQHAASVFAVDISESMIDLVRAKIEKNNIDNITAVNAGFLNFDNEGKLFDVIFSSLALHHLPDFWKFIALKRVHSFLKPGGKFNLVDVAFSLPDSNYDEAIDGWLAALGQFAGKKVQEESLVHIKEEHSTLDWIMELILEKAGFTIEEKFEKFPNIWSYICTKK